MLEWSFHKNLIRVGSPVVRALRDFRNFRNEKLKKQGTRLSILVFLLFYRDGWEKLDVFERLVVSTYIHIYIYMYTRLIAHSSYVKLLGA